MLALGLALITLGDRRGQRLGLDRGADARLRSPPAWRCSLGVVVRSSRHPRPIVEPALFAHRSFRIGNLGTLLFAAAFFSLILGNVLFLTSIWGYSVFHAGLATLPGPAADDDRLRPGRQARRPLRPPRRDRPRHPVHRRRDHGPALRRPDPDWLGLWLPGASLTGIGIGLAFPTLGSAAVRDVADDRFATASAVNAAFRQVGAVLGTAILVAIVGDPAALPEALSASDGAYLFAAIASLLAGAVTLALRPVTAPRAATQARGARRGDGRS